MELRGQRTELPPLPRQEVRLTCPGSRLAAMVVNGRFLRLQCRHKFCVSDARKELGLERSDKVWVFHLWSLATGMLVATEYEAKARQARVIHEKGEDHGGIR